MALSSATHLTFRRLHQLYRNPGYSRIIEDKLSCQSKLFHLSSLKNNKNLESRLWDFFKTSQKAVTRFKLQDKVPENFTLIYKAPMESNLKYGYLVVLGTAIGGPCFFLYNACLHGELTLVKEAKEIPFLNPQLEIWIFAGMLVLCTWALCAFMFKYPVRVYKNNDKQQYIAIFMSAIPMKMKQFHFQNALRTNFRNPLYFFTKNCHFFLDGKKKTIFLTHYFRTQADLCEMLGVD